MKIAFETIKDFESIGIFRKTHGVEGQIRLDLYEGWNSVFEDDISFLFLEQMGSKVPYKLKTIINSESFYIVGFEEFSNREDVQFLVSTEAFVPFAEFNQKEDLEDDGSEYENSEWIGYLVSDLNLGEIGEIVDFEELPGQDMLVVSYQNQLKLIPLVEEYVVEINYEEAKLMMDLPDGLLSL